MLTIGSDFLFLENGDTPHPLWREGRWWEDPLGPRLAAAFHPSRPPVRRRRTRRRRRGWRTTRRSGTCLPPPAPHMLRPASLEGGVYGEGGAEGIQSMFKHWDPTSCVSGGVLTPLPHLPQHAQVSALGGAVCSAEARREKCRRCELQEAFQIYKHSIFNHTNFQLFFRHKCGRTGGGVGEGADGGDHGEGGEEEATGGHRGLGGR